MKYMFASDVHGSAHYCRKMLEAYRQSGADRLILLGDLLYHGPRNDLPQEYAPKQVIAMLNEYKNEIIAVRGNCEAEVDQMVLEFPVMADYAILVLNGLTFFSIFYLGNLIAEIQNFFFQDCLQTKMTGCNQFIYFCRHTVPS